MEFWSEVFTLYCTFSNDRRAVLSDPTLKMFSDGVLVMSSACLWLASYLSNWLTWPFCNSRDACNIFSHLQWIYSYTGRCLLCYHFDWNTSWCFEKAWWHRCTPNPSNPPKSCHTLFTGRSLNKAVKKARHYAGFVFFILNQASSA